MCLLCADPIISEIRFDNNLEELVRVNTPIKPGTRLKRKGHNFYFPSRTLPPSPGSSGCELTRVVLRSTPNGSAATGLRHCELPIVQHGACSTSFSVLVPQRLSMPPGECEIRVIVAVQSSPSYECRISSTSKSAHNAGAKHMLGSTAVDSEARTSKRRKELMDAIRRNGGFMHRRRR